MVSLSNQVVERVEHPASTIITLGLEIITLGLEPESHEWRLSCHAPIH